VLTFSACTAILTCNDCAGFSVTDPDTDSQEQCRDQSNRYVIGIDQLTHQQRSLGDPVFIDPQEQEKDHQGCGHDYVSPGF